jgi:hypothetical protein
LPAASRDTVPIAVPPDLAVAAHDTKVEPPLRVPPGEERLAVPAAAFAILGVHVRQPACVRDRSVRREPEKLAIRRRDLGDIFRHVPVPGAPAAGLQREVQPLFAGAQGFDGFL